MSFSYKLDSSFHMVSFDKLTHVLNNFDDTKKESFFFFYLYSALVLELFLHSQVRIMHEFIFKHDCLRAQPVLFWRDRKNYKLYPVQKLDKLQSFFDVPNDVIEEMKTIIYQFNDIRNKVVHGHPIFYETHTGTHKVSVSNWDKSAFSYKNIIIMIKLYNRFSILWDELSNVHILKFLNKNQPSVNYGSLSFCGELPTIDLDLFLKKIRKKDT